MICAEHQNRFTLQERVIIRLIPVSLKFLRIQQSVIKSKIAGNKIFYVWDTDKKLFVKKELSKEELKSYKKADTSDNAEKTTHSLNNDSDREIIRVTTQKDSTRFGGNQKSGDNAGWHK